MDLIDGLPRGCQVLADRACERHPQHDPRERRTAAIPSTPRRNPVIPHDQARYKDRHRAARFFNKIKNYRAVATRCDKRDDSFLASVQLASIRIWLRSYKPVS